MANMPAEADEQPDENTDDGLEPQPQRFWRPIRTQRTLQVALGLFWLLVRQPHMEP